MGTLARRLSLRPCAAYNVNKNEPVIRILPTDRLEALLALVILDHAEPPPEPQHPHTGCRFPAILTKMPGIKTNSRCRLLPESDARRGTVKYIGTVSEIPGLGAWIGIALDEPTGKNNGSIKGATYFECPTNCGVFVRPERVEMGDFPALDDFDDEDEEF